MKYLSLIFLSFFLHNCQQAQEKPAETQIKAAQQDSFSMKSYEQVKQDITSHRKLFSTSYFNADEISRKKITDSIADYWVNAISKDLFGQWEDTPWDYNGTTSIPQQGSIACGYFVTAILQDMDVKLNRIKLSTCASSEMMKSLTPWQAIKRLNRLSYTDFNEQLKKYGKGVYVIGLDFHTGIIVNDGKENWFIHSNYIDRMGVTKEAVSISEALQSSKTRWIVSLTGDKDFIERWLRQ